MAVAMARIKWAIINTGKRLDANEGLRRDAVRSAWGFAWTVSNTVSSRQLTTLRWSRSGQRWHHRWAEGKVNDTEWWRSPHLYSTQGDDYDMHDLLWRHYRPQSGDVVFDVGAGNGGETLFLAGMVGKTGRVIAVEAAPGPFSRLAEMRALNDWPQVELHQVALAAEAGTVMMSDSEDWITGNMYEAGNVEVRAVSLDELCAELGIQSIDWLKLNIEGAEKEAVLGMERMAPHIRHLMISCHDFLGTEWGRSKAQVTGWLVDHGFDVMEHEPGMVALEDYLYASRAGA